MGYWARAVLLYQHRHHQELCTLNLRRRRQMLSIWNRLIQPQRLDLSGHITHDMATDGFTRIKAGTRAGVNHQQPAQTAGFLLAKHYEYRGAIQEISKTGRQYSCGFQSMLFR